MACCLNYCVGRRGQWFLSKPPATAAASGHHGAALYETAPAFNLLLHFWIQLAGYDQFLLRLLPIAFWLVTLVGLAANGFLLDGRRGAVFVTIAAVLMPYHWLFPTALRWYTLAASLAVWNFFFFTCLRFHLFHAPISNRRPGIGDSRWAATGWWLGYVLTGTALWYTIYAAPAFFVSHLMILVLSNGRRLRSIRLRNAMSMLLAWIAILILYMPWMPVFLRQLSLSVGSSSKTGIQAPIATVLSLYVLFAGEFAAPYLWWISVPLALAVALFLWLLLVERESSWPSTLTATVVLTLMSLTSTLWTKRLLIASPFVGLSVGLLAATSPDAACFKRVRVLRIAVAIYALCVIGIGWQAISRDDWVSYRWLDPVASAVRHGTSLYPNAIWLTNSNGCSCSCLPAQTF